MKIIIAGSRGFSNYDLLKTKCDYYLSKLDEVIIVSGGARGADSLGERYAREKGYQVEQYLADWNRYGKSAGYRRNAEMAEVADGLIAFWDGKSSGTKHMIDLMKKKTNLVRVVVF